VAVRPPSRAQRWIARRSPPARKVTLNQRRIFILPSRVGVAFLLSLLLLLLAAINFQSNLIFALAFFLLSLMLVGILHTFANLAGLTVEAVRAHPTFAGEQAEFDLQLSSAGRRHYRALHLGWPGSGSEATVSVAAGGSSSVRLFLPAERRGWLQPPWLCVETVYPLGLLRAWSWIDLDIAALVYPRPLPGPRPDSIGSGEPDGERQLRSGSEDFHGFRPYRAGDNLRHVMWRAWARGQPLQSKQFAELQMRSHWLDWEATSGKPEQRLGLLCHWVLELERRGEPYALQLPDTTLPLGLGERQREKALRALALFGLPAQPPRRGRG
jgi:uncharacterized protein (DUF58 family)